MTRRPRWPAAPVMTMLTTPPCPRTAALVTELEATRRDDSVQDGVEGSPRARRDSPHRYTDVTDLSQVRAEAASDNHAA
jgi:hypothetical protein